MTELSLKHPADSASGGRRRSVGLNARILLAAIRLFTDRKTARLALRFSLRAYPDAATGARRRRLRFLARTLWYARTSRRWYGFLDAEPVLRDALHCMPDLAEKLHRPYARAGFGAARRLDALLAHYRGCATLAWSPVLSAIARKPFVLAAWRDKEGQNLSLVLDRPQQFAKEGELTLHIERDGQCLGALVFSLRERDAQRTVDVGCLQGPAGEDSRQQVRDLTRACHGLRPKNLLLEALRAIAQAGGCGDIVGVSSERHIYRNPRKRRAIAFDYDAFWSEAGGLRRADGDWSMPLAVANRPLEEVASRKRAETLRKRALVGEIQNQIAARFAAVLGDACADGSRS